MAGRRHSKCCFCLPLRLATFLGALLIGAFGGAGSYLFFTNQDLPQRTFTFEGVSVTPLTSGQALWYYVAAVSVLAAAVGLLGMVSALVANRRMVKTFEAFYVLSLLTQFALTAWALVWCKQNQSQFDTICNANKSGLVSLPLPSFMNDWTCQKIFMAIILTIGIGGLIWIFFNFYMTNRVIHYARELFADRADRYKVLGEAATKELDREQQIPLNYTNVGRSMPEEEGEGFQNAHPQQPSYRDEIEYKDPRGNQNFQYPRAAAAGFGAFDQGADPQHQLQQSYHAQQPHPAPGFNYRDSAQDLFNPYHNHGEQEHIPTPPAPAPASSSSSSAAAFAAIPPPPTSSSSSSALAPAGGQSFTHASTAKIASPFDDDDDLVDTGAVAGGAGVGLTPLTMTTSRDDVKVPLPPSPRDGDILSPTSPTGRKTPPSNLL
ncbi:hypothetical protein BGZ97_004216 [Linnemannia gamsii]|uniref:Uncharacterized protein n=1 Tax=Linnemannia gamsii TaxID=64522 RepID=A0A9P6QU19_9FUNG|nr:hypothetical protein BGZ97_004216 [Linnemannia gamsii]